MKLGYYEMKKLIAFFVFLVLSMIMFMKTAFAYIDPSAMTFLIQIIAGVAITVGAALGFYFRKIKRAVTKRKRQDEDEDDDECDDEDEDE